MYELKTYEEQSFKMYQIFNKETNSWFTLCPERGGIIISFGVNGEELLYLNKETLLDRNKNIRGGIPILFPISGQLENGEYEWDGKTYSMPNHGLARINPWEVVDQKLEDDQGSITIRFTSNDETKQSYPFDFEVLYTYVLQDNQLKIEQSYRNLSDKAMPIYAGFHPYFLTTTKTFALETDAKTYLDYNDGEVKEFTGTVDMSDKPESIVLLDAKDRTVGMKFGDKHIVMETGEEFPYTVIWTEEGKDFVCVEPWMAKTGEFARGDELQIVPANGVLETVVVFRGE